MGEDIPLGTASAAGGRLTADDGGGAVKTLASHSSAAGAGAPGASARAAHQLNMENRPDLEGAKSGVSKRRERWRVNFREMIPICPYRLNLAASGRTFGSRDPARRTLATSGPGEDG